MDRDLSAVARAGPPWDVGAEGVRPTIRTTELPTLDAHAHVDPARTPEELRRSGAVLAMTLSLDEAAQVIGRPEPQIAWGVGCHPRKPKAQRAFDASRFGELAERTAIVGEIGLDARWSCVPFQDQVRVPPGPRLRRQAPSIHEHPQLLCDRARARGAATKADRRAGPTRVDGHGGRDARGRGVGVHLLDPLGGGAQSKFRTAVPPERILVESDHGWADPPSAIPCRIEWVEHLVAQQLGSSVGEVRRLVWENLARIIRVTGTSCRPRSGRSCVPVRTSRSESCRDGRRDPSGRAGVG